MFADCKLRSKNEQKFIIDRKKPVLRRLRWKREQHDECRTSVMRDPARCRGLSKKPISDTSL